MGVRLSGGGGGGGGGATTTGSILGTNIAVSVTNSILADTTISIPQSVATNANVVFGTLTATSLGSLNISTTNLSATSITASALGSLNLSATNLQSSIITATTISCTYLTATNMAASTVATGNLIGSNIAVTISGTVLANTTISIPQSVATNANAIFATVTATTIACTNFTATNMTPAVVATGNLIGSNIAVTISGSVLANTTISIPQAVATNSSVVFTAVTATNIGANCVSTTNLDVVANIEAATLTATTISATTLTASALNGLKIMVTNTTSTNISGTGIILTGNISSATCTATTQSGTTVTVTSLASLNLSTTNLQASIITATTINCTNLTCTNLGGIGIKFVAPLNFSGIGSVIVTTDPVGTNAIAASKFYLPYNMTVNTLAAIVSISGNNATMNLGVWNGAATTKLVDTGAICASRTGYFSGTVTATVFPQGFYWCGHSFSDNAVKVRGWTNNGLVGIDADGKVQGTAANATAGGTMPNALGAITSNTNNGSYIILLT